MKTEIFNLKHGGKVLFNRQKEIQGVSFQLNFTAGALNDKKNKLGIAHFCEHALCGFPNAKMTREERTSYRRKYEYFNAYTSNSDMAFEVRITEEDFEDAVDFLTEQFASIKLTQEEFEKEKKIIEDEIKTSVQRNGLLYTKIARTEIIKDEHFKNTFGSPAGTIETLSNITLADLKEFIETYLTLNNLCITISGNISKKRVKNAMHKYVEQRIGQSSVQGYLPRYADSVYTPKFHFSKSIEKGKAVFACLYNLRQIPWSYEIDRDYIISGILSMILQEYAYLFFRQKKNLCYYCSLGTSNLANYFSNEFYIECQEENLGKIIKSYDEFLKQLPDNIEQKTFEEYKRKSLLQFNFDFMGISKIGDTMHRVYLRENKLYNNAYRKKVFKERRGITYEETNALYKSLFKTKPHVTIVANNEKYKDFDYKSFCKKAKL